MGLSLSRRRRPVKLLAQSQGPKEEIALILEDNTGKLEEKLVRSARRQSLLGSVTTSLRRPSVSGKMVRSGRDCLYRDDYLEVFLVKGRVALVVLLGEDNTETFAWGTRICEHRINPGMIASVNHALDLALESVQVSAVIVTGEGRFFSNGMDLQYIDQHKNEADRLQMDAELLLSRILTFPLPTIAAVNGHCTAAGAMLSLSFDFRIMNEERGLFFVPAIDIGLVYTPGMTALMKSKTPVHMHNDMIVFGTRYTAKDLFRQNVVSGITAPSHVLTSAIEQALQLTEKGRFGDAKYRETMQAIKQNTYREAYEALTDTDNFQGMGFQDGTWGPGGKSKI